MSDTEDPLIVLQHRMQQRQILAMIGINQWVQSGSDTINVANISAPVIVNTVDQSVSSHTAIDSLNIEQLNTDDDINTDISAIDAAETATLDNSAVSSASISDTSMNDYYFDDNGTTLSPPSQPNPVTYRFDTTNTDTVTPNTAVKPLKERERLEATSDEQVQSAERYSDNSLKKVAPFNLQGGRYGNWVVLVDIQALNKDSQKLWRNITQALSITCETTSFPICEGMDTAELANASLAGYVFKIGRSEDIQVAALTALPDGLEHPNLTAVPTLDEMLTDSHLKRQLWEQLSD